ncbi:MAG: hypothetical protein F7C81_07025 [Desulfurococcales archaeon]|nr:hypothetical protein [Desulfurococcales archaeon]
MIGIPVEHMVTWSMVKDMAYCEYMAYLNMTNGMYGYKRAWSKARRVVKSVLKSLERRYITDPIIYTIDGVVFYLRPDAVIFDDNRVSIVLKSYIRMGLKIHDFDFIPLYIAGYLLERIGMNVDSSKLVIIASRSETELSKALRGIIINNTWIHEGSSIKYRIYTEDVAIPLVKGVVELIKGIRNPRPTNNSYTCRRCTYKDTCEFSKL